MHFGVRFIVRNFWSICSLGACPFARAGRSQSVFSSPFAVLMVDPSGYNWLAMARPTDRAAGNHFDRRQYRETIDVLAAAIERARLPIH